MSAITFLLISSLAFSPQGRGGLASNPHENGAVLEITARLIDANGRQVAGASKSGDASFDGFLWTDQQCSLSTSDRDASRALAGWTFSAQITQQTPASLFLQVSWRRAWDNQRRVGEAANSNFERAMLVGDRVQIDRIDLGRAANACAAAVQLEATVTRSVSTSAQGQGQQGQQGQAAGARGGRGRQLGSQGSQGAQGAQGQQGQQGQQAGRGQGQQGQQGQQGAQGQQGQAVQGQRGQQGQQNMQGRGGRGIGAGAVRGSGPGGLDGAPYGAELWLVHTVPDTPAGDAQATTGGRGGRASGRSSAMNRGSSVPSEAAPGEREEVQHQVVRFPASGSGFVFPAMSINTSRGPVSVIVMGAVSAKLENNAPTSLIVTVNRLVTSGENAGNASGSSTKEIPWPAAGEVISFELPPATRSGQDPLAREKLSIRLRMGGPGGIAR